MKPLRSAKKYTPLAFFEVHGNKYDYSKYLFTGSEKKAIFICPVHGEFEQFPYTHLKGVGCPRCGTEKSSNAKRLTSEGFFKECSKTHNNFYSYENAVYIEAKLPIDIICPVHGKFSQEAYSHKAGRGCMKCGREKTRVAKKDTKESFILKAIEKHGEVFDYSESKYRNSQSKIKIICPNGHEFYQTPANHLFGYGCSICQVSPLHSFLHQELGGELNNRSILKGVKGYKEIDLYFEDKKVGFEINGVYFHSEKYVPRNYHQEKIDLAKEYGIKLFHIWYDKNTDNDLILSWAKAKLGIINSKIYARKCEIKEVSAKEYKNFMKCNHLQGDTVSKVKLGLFHEGELVSVIGFSKIVGEWNLTRFASKRHTIVVGGFSKLLSYFIKIHEPKKVVTFSDMSYSDGNVYEKNGFKNIRVSSVPRLYYTNGVTLEDRRKFQKKHIYRRRPDITWSTEREMASEEGFYQLWGCKTIRWELVP